MNNDVEFAHDLDVKIDELIEQKITEPSKYKVIFFNDDATPMEWVVQILMGIFKHSAESAEQIMVQIHTKGSGTVGIYTYEVAEQKAVEATTASREQGHPLQIKVEEE
jgi:ATP-dependent Clp protease adaptor protein ClpS|tara:strand:+ start:996 stop:1319 length:324 start_codon:yes stop_codon:yes gene_type:complete